MGGYKIKNQHGLHFLTLTIVGWVDIFSRKDYKDIIIESLNYCQKEKGLIVFAYVIMSNHIHLIARAKEESKGLSVILRDFKKYTAKQILHTIETIAESRREWLLHVFAYQAKFNTNNRNYQIWIQHNHPVELISPKWIQTRLNYIHLNPVRAGIVEEPEHYTYSSAKDYFTSGKGKLHITLLDLGSSAGYIFMD